MHIFMVSLPFKVKYLWGTFWALENVDVRQKEKQLELQNWILSGKGKGVETNPLYSKTPIRFWVEVHHLLLNLAPKSISNELTKVTYHTSAWAGKGTDPWKPKSPSQALQLAVSSPATGVLPSRDRFFICSLQGTTPRDVSSKVVPDWPAGSASSFIQLSGLASCCLGCAEEGIPRGKHFGFSSCLPLDLGGKFWGYVSGWSLCSLLKWGKKIKESLQEEQSSARQEPPLTHSSSSWGF